MGAEMASRPLLIVAADIGRALMPAQAEHLTTRTESVRSPAVSTVKKSQAMIPCA